MARQNHKIGVSFIFDNFFHVTYIIIMTAKQVSKEKKTFQDTSNNINMPDSILCLVSDIFVNRLLIFAMSSLSV